MSKIIHINLFWHELFHNNALWVLMTVLIVHGSIGIYENVLEGILMGLGGNPEMFETYICLYCQLSGWNKVTLLFYKKLKKKLILYFKKGGCYLPALSCCKVYLKPDVLSAPHTCLFCSGNSFEGSGLLTEDWHLISEFTDLCYDLHI